MATLDYWQSAPSAEAPASGGAARLALLDGQSSSERRMALPGCRARPLARRGLLLKRVLDLGFSIFILVLLAPFLLFLAVAIRLDSPGPVFYLSDRVGRGGRVFRCLKFRTMERDAESRRDALAHLNARDKVLFKVDNDPRVTRLGRLLRRYSLDELPQFLNVLCGHMSVVGPRPPLAGEVTEYGPTERRRLETLPGITGLWQVQGRHDPSFDKYVSLDLTYIENWSLALDLKIMLRTLSVVLSGTGS